MSRRPPFSNASPTLTPTASFANLVNPEPPLQALDNDDAVKPKSNKSSKSQAVPKITLERALSGSTRPAASGATGSAGIPTKPASKSWSWVAGAVSRAVGWGQSNGTSSSSRSRGKDDEPRSRSSIDLKEREKETDSRTAQSAQSRRLNAIFGRRRRVQRFALVLLGLMALYIYLRSRRPTSSPIKPNPAKSEGRRKPHSHTKPLHVRTAASKHRAPLPASVVLQSRSGHRVRNGLLEVDMDSKVHPVYQLIRTAREEWDMKVAKQSKTLKEAVKEYRKRNGGRAPPKGFDKWWAYVVDNNVPLPDEYDQISIDLLPFRALSPAELRLRVSQTSNLRDTYTIRVSSGSVRTSFSVGDDGDDGGDGGIQGARMRLDGQIQLLADVAKDIPDFTAVYSVHDAAAWTISWNHRAELEEYAADGEYLPVDDELDVSLRGWETACGPSSAIRSSTRSQSDAQTGGGRTFIADHRAAMDICSHPRQIDGHGLLAGKNPHHAALVPLFCLSKTTLHADILGVPTEQYSTNVPQVPWEEKIHDKLLWRGSNTGIHFSKETPWRDSHRVRLVRLAAEKQGKKGMLAPPKKADGRASGQSLGDGVWETEKGIINEHYADVAFTGDAIQCDASDGTCDEIKQEFNFVERMTHDDALHYKYVVDVDGNAWSARFQRLLASGSLIFKSTITPEWWTDRIQPWVHYVPIQLDYTDLYDTLAFFRGDLYNNSGEPAIAAQIAQEGKEWVETHWRKQDMTAYVFRLYLEWARLTAEERQGVDFVYDPSMEMERARV